MLLTKVLEIIFYISVFIGTADGFGFEFGCSCTCPANCEWTWGSWSQCNRNNQRVRDIVISKKSLCGGNGCPSNKRETQSCPLNNVTQPCQSHHSTPATLKDMKDAAWASKVVYSAQNSHLNKLFGNTGYRITHIVTKKFEEETAKFLVAESHDNVIVSFRGSTPGQIFEQVTTFLSNTDGVEVTLAGMKTRILKYPWDVMNVLKGELYKISSVWNPTKRVLITGHSFGGSLASLCAAYAMTENSGANLKKNSWLITFGQPRVGDEAFARTHDQIFPPIRKLRIMNEMDIVPHVPPRIPIKYTHISTGIWLKDQSKWTVCRRLESSGYCGNEDMLGAGNGGLDNVENIIGKFMSKSKDHLMSNYIAKLNNPAQSVKYCSDLAKCNEFKDVSRALKSVCAS